MGDAFLFVDCLSDTRETNDSKHLKTTNPSSWYQQGQRTNNMFPYAFAMCRCMTEHSETNKLVVYASKQHNKNYLCIPEIRSKLSS